MRLLNGFLFVFFATRPRTIRNFPPWTKPLWTLDQKVPTLRRVQLSVCVLRSCFIYLAVCIGFSRPPQVENVLFAPFLPSFPAVCIKKVRLLPIGAGICTS